MGHYAEKGRAAKERQQPTRMNFGFIDDAKPIFQHVRLCVAVGHFSQKFGSNLETLNMSANTWVSCTGDKSLW
jgi:hypothetical protein